MSIPDQGSIEVTFLLEADNNDETLFWVHLCSGSRITTSIPLTLAEARLLVHKIFKFVPSDTQDFIHDDIILHEETAHE